MDSSGAFDSRLVRELDDKFIPLFIGFAVVASQLIPTIRHVRVGLECAVPSSSELGNIKKQDSIRMRMLAFLRYGSLPYLSRVEKG